MKKYAQSEMDGFQMKKAVTAVKNEIKDAEQGRDVVISDYFKTLREPLIDQQKRTDEKQDKVIEQFKENQLAITDGIQDIVALNKELPFAIEGEDTTKPTQSVVLDIENAFNDKHDDVISKYGFIQPKELLGKDNFYLDAYYESVKEKRNEISNQLGVLKRKKTEDVSAELNEKKDERETINKYLDAINDVRLSLRRYLPKTGKGAVKRPRSASYKQPKRNAYKISDSHYGGLMIDVPELMNRMKLNA